MGCTVGLGEDRFHGRLDQRVQASLTAGRICPEDPFRGMPVKRPEEGHHEALSFAGTDVLAPPVWHERSRVLSEMVRIGAPYRDCFSFSLAIVNYYDMRSSHESGRCDKALSIRREADS